jgi:hypothetical protein
LAWCYEYCVVAETTMAKEKVLETKTTIVHKVKPFLGGTTYYTGTDYDKDAKADGDSVEEVIRILQAAPPKPDK